MSTNLSVPNTAVSSVGNAWIVCRSKSYAGRIYYFNTLTGETVWNLSEPEMKKAKAMTKILKSHMGFQLGDCPEPLQSPEGHVYQGSSQRPDTSTKYHNMIPATIYNKQVINNQYTKPLPSQIPNVSNAIQLNIPVTPTFNGLWNIAPQPIFVAPTPVHQLQYLTSYNEVPITTTTVSLSNRFKNVLNKRSQNNVKFTSSKRNVKPKFNNNGPRKKYFNQKLQNKINNLDLRLVISSRRSNLSKNDFIQPSNYSGSNTFGLMKNANTNSHKNALREINYNMLNDDDMWLEENLQSQGITEILDSTPLKTYFQIDNSNPLYIIADSDALLNNVNFLNILLNSDKQCRLIVPQIVMNIIQKATNSRLRTAAHRAVYFISQQIDANLATIVQHNGDDEGSNDEKHCIITRCSALMKQNIHVVILTDSVELNVLKETGEMPILTISEIKKLLMNSQLNEIKSLESSEKMKNCNIKITIPNNNETHETNLISPLKEKNDEVELQSSSKLIEPENVPSSVVSPDTDSDLNTISVMTSLSRSASYENIKKGEKKERKRQYSQSERTDSLDSSTKSTVTSNSRNSNFGSSPEFIDQVGHNVDAADSIKNVSHEEIFNVNVETRSAQVSEKTKEVMECDNVMFEVTSQAMEEYLKMKSDEWVSRFIQVMEEVLAVILQQEPEFVPEALPPPWTVYEATECIKRKFKSDSDVVDAATKLLNVLFELGGLRGNIKNDLSPEKYMEMYSFGVYLIDALQGLLNNSEDLQSAAESLSKLLSDIQNPHLDPCNQDGFAEPGPSQELTTQDDVNCYQHEVNTKGITSEPEESGENVNNTEDFKVKNTPKKDEVTASDNPRLYNLRSTRKKIIQDKEDVVFIRHLDIESSFFSSLELRKNVDKGIFSKILSKDTQIENQDSIDDKDQTLPEVNVPGNGDGSKEPTFIRNVTKCLEFEEKLRENSEIQYDSWTHRNEEYEDYEELDYGSTEEGYYMDGEYNFNEEMYESDEDPDEMVKHSDDLEVPEDLPNEDNNFKIIVEKMQNHIKGAYTEVHEFCKNSFEKLSSKDLDKNDILLAEKMYSFIENLCTTFNRILERETSESEYRLQEVFRHKEFEGVVIAEKDLEDYRSFINNCLVQGNILRESVSLIIDASRETTLYN